MRKTKIVCTMGPACRTEEMLAGLLKAGMNVLRLNFSHGSREEQKENIRMFKAAREKQRVPAALLLDTKGPEIRIGTFPKGSVTLSAGQTFTFYSASGRGDENGVSISYPELWQQVQPGTLLLLDDGKLEMEVDSVSPGEVHCRVRHDGDLSNRKSINIPGVSLPMPYLSPADREDLLLGIEEDVDYVAASFCRSGEDVRVLRRFLQENGGSRIHIIAKIENQEGVQHFADILEEADGIMVARGDMGVEIPFAELPGVQKKLLAAALQAGKISITATQMLESMIWEAMPTRAEITDVFNAVLDGTSAVMLSGETAVGENPPHVVEVMDKILREAEKARAEEEKIRPLPFASAATASVPEAVCQAAVRAGDSLPADAIIAITKSGDAARLVSKFRPTSPVLALTPEVGSYHQLSLSYGVIPLMSKICQNSDDLFHHAVVRGKEEGYLSPGDTVVMTLGLPLGRSGTTNSLKVETVF